MNGQLQKSQQQHQRISLEYAQKKNVLDKLAELMEYGVTQETLYNGHKYARKAN